MPVYAYKGFTQSGKSVAGSQDADSPRAIKALLRKDGIIITSLAEASGGQAKGRLRALSRWRPLADRVSTQDLAVSTRQLSTLIGAGIPLVDALVALIDQVENARLKSIWADVKQRVNEGTGFGDALGAHPRVFSTLYVNMVRAGETSGALDVVLGRLADFTESQAELKSKLTGTMVYPALMTGLSVVVVAILMTVVVPKITVLFASQKAALPLPTRVLLAVSSTFERFWALIFGALVVLAGGFRRYIDSPRGRPWWDGFILRAPLFGPLVRMVAITRFSRTLATLLGSGVNLLSAFDIVKNVVANTQILRVIESARDSVKEGDSIAAPLKRSGQFPPMVTHMIAIGERSGTLEQMLANVAKSYEVQVDARLRAMTSILEPLLLVVMGAVVAFIVFAVLMPMMEMTSFAG